VESIDVIDLLSPFCPDFAEVAELMSDRRVEQQDETVG